MKKNEPAYAKTMARQSKKIVVLYDGDECPDGFGGAWVAWKKFKNTAEYIGVLHNEPVPIGLKNKIIYLIDFTYSEKEMMKLANDNIKVVSIDHHVSAEKATKAADERLFSIKNSGSVLAWIYFNPSKPVPVLLKYIEDFDLWNKKLPYHDEIFSYISLQQFNFNIWEKLEKELENKKSRKISINKGLLLLKYKNKQITTLLENNSELVKFEGYKTLAINSPLFNSQLGALASQKLPPMGIVWKMMANNSVYVSLRSNGKVDVSKIAAKFGGGGHRRAAGFILLPKTKLPWKFLKKYLSR